MKIAVLGATRGTGRQVLDQALARGDEVVALVRDPSSLPKHDRLAVVQGDARNAADVEKALSSNGSNVDAVMSCIGSSNLKNADRLVSTCATATVEAMQRAKVKRLIFVSVQGIGDSARLPVRMAGAVMKLVAAPVYDTIFEDKSRAEAIFRGAASSLEYTFVRAPSLNDKPPKGKYRAMPSADGRNPAAKISRADLALFMLNEVSARRWVDAAVLVCD